MMKFCYYLVGLERGNFNHARLSIYSFAFHSAFRISQSR
jgi:hypothetical protein